VEEQDTSGFDIVKATQYGAIDRVHDIIEGGFDVNQRDEVGTWIKSHFH
jgi:palmitoyltransferase